MANGELLLSGARKATFKAPPQDYEKRPIMHLYKMNVNFWITFKFDFFPQFFSHKYNTLCFLWFSKLCSSSDFYPHLSDISGILAIGFFLPQKLGVTSYFYQQFLLLYTPLM